MQLTSGPIARPDGGGNVILLCKEFESLAGDAPEEPVTTRKFSASPLVLGLALAGALAAATPAGADDSAPHRVRYSVSSTQTAQALVYYREVQPPNFGEYSHDPYLYSPRADVTIGPNQPWIFETSLADPQDWAMVVVSLPAMHPELRSPGFVCELRIDDVVVATDAGTKGALCSLRTW